MGTKTVATREALCELVAGLGPGTRLPSERDLAKQLRASRTMLRQVLRELVAAGLLELRARSGYYAAKEVPCSAKVLKLRHPAHGWAPQPGMTPVPCHGYHALSGQEAFEISSLNTPEVRALAATTTDADAEEVLRRVEERRLEKRRIQMTRALKIPEASDWLECVVATVKNTSAAERLAKATTDLAVMQGMMERMPEQHMRFGQIGPDGATELLPCADWCYACKLDRLKVVEEILDRVAVWAAGPCPHRPQPFQLEGDRAFGFVQAMDEVSHLLAGGIPPNFAAFKAPE